MGGSEIGGGGSGVGEVRGRPSNGSARFAVVPARAAEIRLPERRPNMSRILGLFEDGEARLRCCGVEREDR